MHIWLSVAQADCRKQDFSYLFSKVFIKTFLKHLAILEPLQNAPIVLPPNFNLEIGMMRSLELPRCLDAQKLSVTGDTAKYLVLHSREVVQISPQIPFNLFTNVTHFAHRSG